MEIDRGQALTEYKALGPNRSIRKLANVFATKWPDKRAPTEPTLYNWSSQGGWQELCGEHDTKVTLLVANEVESKEVHIRARFAAEAGKHAFTALATVGKMLADPRLFDAPPTVADIERIRRTVTISSAVFDGKREVFAHGFNNVVIEDRIQPRFGGWAEHHPERVADWRRQVKAADAPAPVSWHAPPAQMAHILCS